MQSKLLLTLWLIGGLLYAASTVFLAHTLLGGGSSGDKGKSMTVAAADAKCEKDSIASAGADPTKTAALDPKTAADAQKPAGPSAKPDAAQSQPDTAAPGPEANQEPADQPAALPPDEAGMPQGEEPWQVPNDQDQAGMQGPGENAMETEEWAHVIAGTADMRSEPSLDSPLIYALPSGWQVRVISRERGWVQVQDANSGAAGWVEATAIAPGAGPNAHPGYGAYPPRPGDPYRRYADEGYPYGPPPWQRRRGQFGDFLNRMLGGF
jgi:hypothetical protein